MPRASGPRRNGGPQTATTDGLKCSEERSHQNVTRSTTYYMLIGSLPTLPRHFELAERVPISPLALDRRLALLQPRDAEVLREVADFLAWERQPLERTDEDVVEQFREFQATVANPFARDLIRHTISVRSILAALRCRRLALDPPGGIEPLAGRIAEHWNHPDFRLANRYPWVAEVNAILTGDQPLDLERKQLNIVWDHAKGLADKYHFTFEAVILYLIRWEVVSRWTRRTAKVGQKKFEHLVVSALSEYTEMFPPESESNR